MTSRTAPNPFAEPDVLLDKLVDRCRYAGHDVAEFQTDLAWSATLDLTPAEYRRVWSTPIDTGGEHIRYVADTPSMNTPIGPRRVRQVFEAYRTAVGRLP